MAIDQAAKFSWDDNDIEVGARQKGGPGSGNFGHGGRPGKRGGSAGGGARATKKVDPIAAYTAASSRVRQLADMTGVVALDDEAARYIRSADILRRSYKPEEMMALKTVSGDEFEQIKGRLIATTAPDTSDFDYDIRVNASFEVHPPAKVTERYEALVEEGGGEVENLLHGTDDFAAVAIGQEGFKRAREVGDAVDMMGEGVYLADNSAQALQYVGGTFEPTAPRAFGAIVESSLAKGRSGEWKPGVKMTVASEGFDSMHATAGDIISDDEWVVRDPARILPQYIHRVTRLEKSYGKSVTKDDPKVVGNFTDPPSAVTDGLNSAFVTQFVDAGGRATGKSLEKLLVETRKVVTTLEEPDDAAL